MRKFLLAAAAMALAAPAFAQSPPPPQRGPHPGPGAIGCAVRDGKAAKFLARAHDRLKISGAQEAAWSQFTVAVETAVKPLADDCGKPPVALKAEPLPDRLAVMEGLAKRHLVILEQIQAAVATLYDRLTPEQQAVANHLAFHHRPGGPDGVQEGPRKHDAEGQHAGYGPPPGR